MISFVCKKMSLTDKEYTKTAVAAVTEKQLVETIILQRERERERERESWLLYFNCDCVLVSCGCLCYMFLHLGAESWYVIVAFPGHTHLVFVNFIL